MDRQRTAGWKRTGIVFALILGLMTGVWEAQASQASENGADASFTKEDSLSMEGQITENRENAEEGQQTQGRQGIPDMGTAYEEEPERSLPEETEIFAGTDARVQDTASPGRERASAGGSEETNGSEAEDTGGTESAGGAENTSGNAGPEDPGVIEENAEAAREGGAPDQADERADEFALPVFSDGAAGLEMTVHPDLTEAKAGTTVTFDVCLENTGDTELSDIQLQSILSPEGAFGKWQQEEGLTISAEGGTASLKSLFHGESRHLTLLMEIPEDRTNPIENTIQASVKDPLSESAVLRCEETLCTTVLPLLLDFRVEKTADCLAARPGDTVTYHITITNTGERTLHSVLSTERFQLAQISARFVKQQGVLISKDGTQAFIPEISPGRAVQLEAVVQIPESLSGQELVNQVTVTTAETGEAGTVSEAAILVAEPTSTPTPSPVLQQESGTGDGGSQTVSSNPKTGDPSEPGKLLGLIAASGLLVLLTLIYRKKVKQ